MLDTDTCIYLINRHPKMQRKAPPAQCAISVIVLGELERAVRRSKRPEPTVEFMHRINVIPLEDDAARAYGYIRDYLESTGQMIGPNDLWIAACIKRRAGDQQYTRVLPCAGTDGYNLVG